MSGCLPEALEAYALGELDEAEAARVAAHVARCTPCAEELRWLRRERRLFATRAADHPAPPPFEAVLARALAAPVAEAKPARPIDPLPTPARRRPRRAWAPRTAAAAAALALAAVLLALPREEAPPLTAEPRAAYPEMIQNDPPPAPEEPACEECSDCGEASSACAPEHDNGCVENSCVTCGP
jgi:anti-sigma factor RsiW